MDVTPPPGWGDENRSLRVPQADALGRQVWLARTDAHGRDGQWVAEAIVQAVERATEALGAPKRRARRLIGVPLAGTGAGGLSNRRGEVVEALVPVLGDVAQCTGVDVALVLADDQDHAAVQACRSRLTGGPGATVLDAAARQRADALGGSPPPGSSCSSSAPASASPPDSPRGRSSSASSRPRPDCRS